MVLPYLSWKRRRYLNPTIQNLIGSESVVKSKYIYKIKRRVGREMLVEMKLFE
jgi:hypothetical protein|tara:strand:+ start:905 stop:1063 length:159 start_codon:yes stop_codon:yes gene_type:complete